MAKGGNDGSPSGRYLRKHDMAQCFAVAADADIILSLNQTDDEMVLNEMRILTEKVREAVTGRMVLCNVDKANMTLTEKGSMSGARKRGPQANPIDVAMDNALNKDEEWLR